MRSAFFFIFVFLLAAPLAGSSFSPDSTEITEIQTESSLGWIQSTAYNQVHELTFWGGHAFGSMKLWGKTPNSTMNQFGLGYSRKRNNHDLGFGPISRRTPA